MTFFLDMLTKLAGKFEDERTDLEKVETDLTASCEQRASDFGRVSSLEC